MNMNCKLCGHCISEAANIRNLAWRHCYFTECGVYGYYKHGGAFIETLKYIDYSFFLDVYQQSAIIFKINHKLSEFYMESKLSSETAQYWFKKLQTYNLLT